MQKCNSFSEEIKQMEDDNCNLVKRNAANLVEISSLKAEVVVLRKEIEDLLDEDEREEKEECWAK